ncbi:MAG: hypothetical protein HYX34_06985 [Actinobacteria bacterium]|nr:hypothetical protein [Actinomycetota bacterium]
MTGWRESRNADEAVPATCENLRELALAYSPFVAFSPLERFFPALAEAWLQHATTAAWPAASRASSRRADPFDRPVDPFRRGSAVCTAPPDVSSVTVLGGTPDEDDRPIQLTDEPTDPDSISAYRTAGGDTFIDVGGWADRGPGPGFEGRAGDLDYLFRAFSELAAAMNPALDPLLADLRSWEPVELMAHLPQMWTRQPPSPTVYCEARWARDFVAAPDFPPGAEGPLGGHLVLTYHYLFPAREPSEGEPDVRAQEGQWEAVSLVFRGRDGQGPDAVFFEPPVAVVVGQGSDTGGPIPHASEVRRWQDTARAAQAPTHVALVCSRGTHRFFFAPRLEDTPWSPSGPPSTSDGGQYDNNSEFPGWESVLIGGLLAAAAIALLFGGPIGWAIAAVIAILALLIWLISLIADLCNDSSENPANPNPSNPEAAGDGPWGGDDAGPPAAGAPGGDGGPGADGGGDPAGGWGLPNSGSPIGANTVSFDVRFVDSTGRDRRPAVTAYPSEAPCERPSWWDFPGRWGVRVSPRLDSTWASGTQRVDELARCRGYWHTLRFLSDILLAG